MLSSGKLAEQDREQVNFYLPKLKDMRESLLDLVSKFESNNAIEHADHLLNSLAICSFFLGVTTHISASSEHYVKGRDADRARRAKLKKQATNKQEEDAAKLHETRLQALKEAIANRRSGKKNGFSVTRADATKLCPQVNVILAKNGAGQINVTKTLGLLSELRKQKKSELF